MMQRNANVEVWIISSHVQKSKALFLSPVLKKSVPVELYILLILHYMCVYLFFLRTPN